MSTKNRDFEDTYVWETSPTTNFGSSANMLVDQESGDEKKTLLDFDFSNYSRYDVVQANFRMYQHDFGYEDLTVDVTRVTSSFDADTVTWNTLPSKTLFPMTTFTVKTGEWIGFSILGYAQAVLDGEIDNYGFILDDLVAPDPTTDRMMCPTLEYGNSSLWPYVELTTIEDYGNRYTVNVEELYGGTAACITLNAKVEFIELDGAGDTARLLIRPPWTSTLFEEYLDVDETATFTSGNNTFTVTVTQIFEGIETYWIDMTCIWTVDEGDRYVSKEGDDSNSGLMWGHEFRTVTKAMTEVGSDGDVNIKHGVYADETAPEPVRDCNLVLHTDTNVVAITEESLTLIRSKTFDLTYSSTIYDGTTHMFIDPLAAFTSEIPIASYDFGVRTWNTDQITIDVALMILSDDGTYYHREYLSPWTRIEIDDDGVNGLGHRLSENVSGNIVAQSGQLYTIVIKSVSGDLHPTISDDSPNGILYRYAGLLEDKVLKSSLTSVLYGSGSGARCDVDIGYTV